MESVSVGKRGTLVTWAVVGSRPTTKKAIKTAAKWDFIGIVGFYLKKKATTKRGL
jgi:hypothetical protein